ncbi:single-stranded DNA-binding protein [Bifidobacterium sp. 82T24]|uniref:single-stranded DNA-binding protein n=1 Tax=Bifidobacterium pluvialisilvae TaxID=2834436 RepID=UPI001C566783|nr:single-stranded DNA-binding protein [Bifidobacterium pluvialisilvae]MBW3088799.1 single-stranded DNA-binding protein [Bifidobacterium pluvialisilvae]
MANETVITVIGNLTADPELRQTPGGGTVVNFTIASTPSHWDAKQNQWVDEDAMFLRCSAWDGRTLTLATNIAQSLTKGMRVIAQGRLRQRRYTDDQGVNRTATELRVDEIGTGLSRYQTVAERTKSGNGQPVRQGGYQGGFVGAQHNQPHPPSPQSQACEATQDPWGGHADYGTPQDEFNTNGEPDF